MDYIQLKNYLIQIRSIDAIRIYEVNYEYKDAIFGIEIILRGREHSLDIRYNTAEERDEDFERLTNEITIV